MNRIVRATCLLSLVTLAALLTACSSQPVQSPTGSVPLGKSGVPLKLSVIQEAVADSCRAKRWTPTLIGDDVVQCGITVRGRHHAVVDIEIRQSNYRIVYRESNGLDYRNGNIHRNYNKWVTLLSRTINQALLETSASH